MTPISILTRVYVWDFETSLPCMLFSNYAIGRATLGTKASTNPIEKMDEGPPCRRACQIPDTPRTSSPATSSITVHNHFYSKAIEFLIAICDEPPISKTVCPFLRESVVGTCERAAKFRAKVIPMRKWAPQRRNPMFATSDWLTF